uniref:Calcineurin-like phosphoesterase n=1 Tax=viral metagenome TaxID=1070528 RepID=A0A6M3XLZ9_9ZZZZ
MPTQIHLKGKSITLKHKYPFRFGIISDLQVGAQHGIHPAEFVDVISGQPYPLNEAQKVLLGYLDNFINRLNEFKVMGLFVIGDVISGQNWYERGRYEMYVDMEIQTLACATLLTNICKRVPSLEVVILWQGTPYHGSRDTSVEQSVAGKLRNLLRGVKTKNKIEVIYAGEYSYIPLEFDGKKRIIWVAHHASGGFVYPAGGVERDLREFLVKIGEKRLQPIHFVIRAHKHDYIEVHKAGIRGLMLPCWQFFVPYPQAIKRYPFYQPCIGGVILLVDEELRFRPWHFTYPNVEDPLKFIMFKKSPYGVHKQRLSKK